MRAIQLVGIGRPLQEQQVSIPPLGPKEIRVRIKAAGICHSDVHYRNGSSPVGPLPQTLGHEIAGVVEEIGSEVLDVALGERVCLHYLVTCGDCHYCRTGHEQFCVHGRMLGKHCDGGYAETITVPARNAVSLPPEVSFEHGAIMMCSSSTSFHALRKAELQPGESVAIFGAGGLGMSAVQLALALGAVRVYAVDIHEAKLKLAETYGAIPVNASQQDPVAEIARLTNGRGVDVALEVIGLRTTMEQAVQTLAVFGRAVMVGIADEPLCIDSYRDLLCKEARVAGSSDHLLWELPILIEFARQGKLDLSQVVTRIIPLVAPAINDTLDTLQHFAGGVRTVIVP
jgi:2-desacetyl-2-hydroxyethyl bacteriochlorophyllide A dehydrogenase